MTRWIETPDLLVSNCALRPVVAVEPGTTLQQAARTMRRENVSSALVGRRGETVRVLTQRDLTEAYARGLDPSARVDEVASVDLLTVEPDTTLRDAAALMLANGISHLVVGLRGHAIGVISMRDVLGGLSESTEPAAILDVVQRALNPHPENWLG